MRAPPSRRSASRATSRSSNGSTRRRSPVPARGPCRRSRRRRPARRGSTARAIAARAVGLDLELRRAGEDLVDDRARILAARVVGGDDRDVGELGGDAAPSAGACRGRGRRRSRRRRSRGRRRRARAPRGARSRARPACARSRRSPRTAAPRRPSRIGPGTPGSGSSAAPRSRRRRSRAAARAATAASAFSTLKRPAQPQVDAVERAPGRARRSRRKPKVSASGQLRGEPAAPLVADVDRGRRPASRRRAAASPRSTRSIVPWKSRWSWREVREDERREADAVEAAVARSACDVASIAQLRLPASSICAERALQVDRLGRRSARPAAARRRRGVSIVPTGPGAGRPPRGSRGAGSSSSSCRSCR